MIVNPEIARITFKDKKDYQVPNADEEFLIRAKDMNEIKNTFNDSAQAIQNALNQVSEAYNYLGDYKVENGLFYFKKADGAWGEGINLNVSVEEFESVVRRVTSLETNGVAVGDTLPHGSIVYVEGDEKDIPTGYQKLDIVPQPSKQLLINNDFQVNQRGQTAYSGEMKKCFDGWFLIRGYVTNVAYATYPKPENGILMVYNTEYENNQLWQFLDGELDYEKYYTLSYMVDGVHYSFTFKPTPTGYQENVHDKFRIYTALESSRQKRAVCIDLFKGKAINLEYIDLFEGKIAYQHRKDYATALIECQMVAREIEINQSGYVAGSTPVKGTINFCIEMNVIPTFVIISAGTRQNVASVSIEVKSKRLIYTITTSAAGYFTLDGYKLILSCETA